MCKVLRKRDKILYHYTCFNFVTETIYVFSFLFFFLLKISSWKRLRNFQGPQKMSFTQRFFSDFSFTFFKRKDNERIFMKLDKVQKISFPILTVSGETHKQMSIFILKDIFWHKNWHTTMSEFQYTIQIMDLSLLSFIYPFFVIQYIPSN